MSELNIELFKKIRERIATIPGSYDQETWISSTPDSPCGTAACLAGEAIICDANTVERGIALLRRIDNRGDVPEQAARKLGIGEYVYHDDDNQAAQLFACAYSDDYKPIVRWPAPFGPRFNKAVTSHARAAAAVAYLDWIIEHKRLS